MVEGLVYFILGRYPKFTSQRHAHQGKSSGTFQDPVREHSMSFHVWAGFSLLSSTKSFSTILRFALSSKKLHVGPPALVGDIYMVGDSSKR